MTLDDIIVCHVGARELDKLNEGTLDAGIMHALVELGMFRHRGKRFAI